ncbi:hypothetical protein [Lacunimicrobium album]
MYSQIQSFASSGRIAQLQVDFADAEIVNLRFNEKIDAAPFAKKQAELLDREAQFS